MSDGRMLFFPISVRFVTDNGDVYVQRSHRPRLCGGRAGWPKTAPREFRPPAAQFALAAHTNSHDDQDAEVLP